MKDLIVTINRNNRQVDLSKSTIGNDGENLQGNIVFRFSNEFVNGQARLEYIIDNVKRYIFLGKYENEYRTPMSSILMKNGLIDMQLVITEGVDEEDVPIFKSNVFFVNCNKSINAEIEQPEDTTSWLDMANTKLNQADNLNISTTPIQNGLQIDTTSKEGVTSSTEVVNGADGYTPIKGVDYFDGQDGKNGKDGEDGYTPVKGVDYFDGKDGKDGEDGYTPVKGKDYFTESDIKEIVDRVLEEIPTSEGVDY